MIRSVNVSKDFVSGDNQVKALDRANLTIPDGDIFGIISFSGAEKTTLLRMVNALPVQANIYSIHCVIITSYS